MFLAPASYTDDLSCLSGTLAEEAMEAYLGVSHGVDFEPSDLLGPLVCIQEQSTC